MPSQEPAFAWPFGNGPVTIGTQGLFRSCLNTHWVILASSAFIIQEFAEVFYSVFVKRSSFKSLLNRRKAYIFQEFAEGLLSICVGWIFQNVHLSKISAAVVPQSKSTEMWSLAAPFHHDLWYFRQRTNEHFRSMLFIRKNLQTAHSSFTQVTEINTLDQITVLIETDHTI